MLKEYKPIKMPDSMSHGMMFNMARGRQLDVFGERFRLKRRKFLIIKEPDYLYKIRLKNHAIRLNGER